MASSSNTGGAINDVENRIVGMIVGSAVADAAGIYTHNLTRAQAEHAYPDRRILASYRADEVTVHFADAHRAKYDVSRARVLCSPASNRTKAVLSSELLNPFEGLQVEYKNPLSPRELTANGLGRELVGSY